MKILRLGTDICFAAGMIAATLYLLRTAPVRLTERPSKLPAADVANRSELGNVRGPETSPIMLVEFGDYECPPCRKVAPIIETLLSKRSDIKFIFYHFPIESIHPHAIYAAKAAEAAGLKGHFWQMHRYLYDRQPEWSVTPDPRPLFIKYAATLGLDTDFFAKAYDTMDRRKIADSQAFAKTVGVKVTPTFFVNGIPIRIPPSVTELEREIERAAH